MCVECFLGAFEEYREEIFQYCFFFYLFFFLDQVNVFPLVFLVTHYFVMDSFQCINLCVVPKEVISSVMVEK